VKATKAKLSDIRKQYLTKLFSYAFPKPTIGRLVLSLLKVCDFATHISPLRKSITVVTYCNL